ncbi:MAG: DUF2201 family putative metallopeptidase [Planctomycetia bacterium]
MSDTIIPPDTLLIARAKLKAAEWMPFLQSVFGPMRSSATARVPTAAVDEYGRMYYNPAWLCRWSVEVVAYVILHETLHCVLSHCRRTRRMVPDLDRHKCLLANIAQDLCIQQALHGAVGGFEPEGIVTLAKWAHIPGITPGRTSEQYFEALLAHRPHAGQPGDQPGDGILEPAAAGSNSDGIGKPWEEAPTLADIGGLENRLREAEAALDAARPSRGSSAGMIREALRARLHPMPDPFERLKHVVGRAISGPLGTPALTYRKWPRRSLPGLPRLRGVERLQPEATVLLDTSGSMLECDVKQRALATVARAIARLERPLIVCCDAAIQSARRVCSMGHFSWDGGGGTDMAAALVHVDTTYRPDAIVIITDGLTGWPASPTRARVVCALCRPEWAGRIPRWVTVVHLHRRPQRRDL